MLWFNVLVGLLTVAGSLLDYLRQRELINGAHATMVRANLTVALELIKEANDARKNAGDKFDADGGMPDASDPNLRD